MPASQIFGNPYTFSIIYLLSCVFYVWFIFSDSLEVWVSTTNILYIVITQTTLLCHVHTIVLPLFVKKTNERNNGTWSIYNEFVCRLVKSPWLYNIIYKSINWRAVHVRSHRIYIVIRKMFEIEFSLRKVLFSECLIWRHLWLRDRLECELYMIMFSLPLDKFWYRDLKLNVLTLIYREH